MKKRKKIGLGNLFSPHDLHRLHDRLNTSLRNTFATAKNWNQRMFIERIQKEFADSQRWPDKSERDMLIALIKNDDVCHVLMTSTTWLKACDLVTTLVFITSIHHRRMNLLHLREWMNSAPNHVEICLGLNATANWLANPYRTELQSLADRIGSDYKAVPFLFIKIQEIGKWGGASKPVGALHGYAVRCLAECVIDNVDTITDMLKACGITTSPKRVRSAIENRNRFRKKP